MKKYVRKTHEIVPKRGNNGSTDTDVGYDGLANAIVVQALIDYSTSVVRILTNNYQGSAQNFTKFKCEQYVKETYHFLLHDAEAYTNLDTEYLIDIIDKRIIDKTGVTQSDIRKLCV